MKEKRGCLSGCLIIFCALIMILMILMIMVAPSEDTGNQGVSVNDAKSEIGLETEAEENADTDEDVAETIIDDPLKEKLISCGSLTDGEIESMCETMNNCGIFDIEKVDRVVASGDLKTVVTVLGEAHGFNVGLDNGEVWYIEATGIASSKTVIYQNFFGAIRTKTVGSTITADMFYEGEYMLYFVEEENKLVNYENRP